MRACLENSGAGPWPALDVGLARENTGARRPEGRRDARPTTFFEHALRTRFVIIFGFTLLVNDALAETVQVPGRANPWLAGMTNGSAARRGDSAPDESPVAITATVIQGGATYAFSAEGSVNHGSTLPLFPPDGEDLISHYLG